MWCILLILLPIALLFAQSSMNNLQSVSIIAAFPIGIVIVMITRSFLKDAKKIWRRKIRVPFGTLILLTNVLLMGKIHNFGL